MESIPHSRNPSAASHAGTDICSAYPFILDHVLTHPPTYEMPLRTMYTINSTPRAQPLPPTRSVTPTFDQSYSPTSPVDPQVATAQFTASLISQLSRLPQQQASLPPAFISAFLHKVFTPEIHLIDFCQALTGLDYLKDLEHRRRKEVAGALERLGITRRTLSQTSEEIAARFPGVAGWICDLETKERKIDQLYSRLYVGLRQWILINEMSLTPFNLHNCHAMLNTLYPPVVGKSSHGASTQLTGNILAKQREGFFRYIKAVEKKGPQVLANLIMQNAIEGETSGWSSTRRILESYLSLANAMIRECQESSPAEAAYFKSPHSATPSFSSQISPIFDMNTSAFDTASISDGRVSRHGRKVDSGVSMHSSRSSASESHYSHSHTSSQPQSRRPSTAFSLRASGSFGSINPTDPLPPPTPSTYEESIPSEFGSSTRPRGSTLERLTRGVLRIRTRRRDTEDSIPSIPSPEYTVPPSPMEHVEPAPRSPPSTKSFRPKSLRKMRSLTALSDLRHGNFSSMTLGGRDRPSIDEVFDPEVMGKKAKEWEAKQAVLVQESAITP